MHLTCASELSVQAGGRGGGGYANKTILPITLATLRTCVPTAGQDAWMLPEAAWDGKHTELSHVRIIARIIEVEEADVTRSIYKLHDNSGEITVTHYISEDDEAYALLRSKLR